MSRKIAPTISIGDLQVEMFFKYLGFSFSRYFTHAGQQEVNIGNGPPFFRRSRNSSDSAIVVKSAPNVVSYTSSTPMSLSAVTSLSSTFSPAGKPNASPTATRTAGAIWMTTRLLGSWMARHASPIWFFTVMAPVVHTAAHWPQLTHFVSASLRSKAGMTCKLLPR